MRYGSLFQTKLILVMKGSVRRRSNSAARRRRREVSEIQEHSALERYTDLYDFAPVGSFTLAASAISKHLPIRYQARQVNLRKEGRWAYCSL
jgi:DNA-binding transcriptional ArsR family regulator